MLSALLCLGIVYPLSGQDIRGYYVSKTDGESTIYHLFPCTLFENRTTGDLTFDITYRTQSGGIATLNFTYEMKQIIPADSIRFVSGQTIMCGEVKKIYIEPDKKHWKSRYSFQADIRSLHTFFNATAVPEAILYSRGTAYVYKVKPAAWNSFAPAADKIFGMIRINEQY